MAAEQKKNDEGQKAAARPLSYRFAIFMLFVTALVFLPTTIVMTICMVPTLVAAVIDDHPHKTAWLTVGAMNFAGAIPACFTLWESGHTIDAAFQVVTQPLALILAFGGAAAGWMIYYNVTPMVALMIIRQNEGRLREIDRRHKDLVKKWGTEVSSF